MKLFPTGHATHPQARMAALMALAQVRAQMGAPGHASAPTLGLLYITDHYADEAQEVLDLLAALSHHGAMSLGCYCDDEAHCHRSVLRTELAARGADIAE